MTIATLFGWITGESEHREALERRQRLMDASDRNSQAHERGTKIRAEVRQSAQEVCDQHAEVEEATRCYRSEHVLASSSDKGED